LREHKGVEKLDNLLRHDGSLVLHVFDPVPRAVSDHGQGRVVSHAGTTPLRDLYSRIDVTLLPQGITRGAQLQLPAKLLDSFRFGVPVMATPTPAIEEIAGGVYYPVSDWQDPAAVVNGIKACAGGEGELAEKARQRFEGELSTEAQETTFAAFMSANVGFSRHAPGVPGR
jgi:hypothetical protein